MKDTKIEWCDHSWSLWRGCAKVSPGCANCYAEKLSLRNPKVLREWGRGRPRVHAKDHKMPIRWNKKPFICVKCGASLQRPGFVHHEPRQKGMPPRPCYELKTTRTTVFPSLCDWLDEEVPVEWLAEWFELIQATPNIIWLMLTKRPENFLRLVDGQVLAKLEMRKDPAEAELREWLRRWINGDPPANVWVGTSVEDQTRADERIPALLSIPAAGRFLSVKPLLGPVELGLSPTVTCRHCDNYVGGHATGSLDICTCRIDWVIIGGESGPRARPCNVDWIRSLVRQCRDASVPCFVKQLGARPTGYWVEGAQCPLPDAGWKLRITHPKGGDPEEWPADLRVRDFREGLR